MFIVMCRLCVKKLTEICMIDYCIALKYVLYSLPPCFNDETDFKLLDWIGLDVTVLANTWLLPGSDYYM